MSQENEIKAEKLSQTTDFLPSDGASCSPSAVRSVGNRMYLKFRPHGYEYPIELPVIKSGSRADTGAWTWNGSLEKPTLRPSIKTLHGGGEKNREPLLAE